MTFEIYCLNDEIRQHTMFVGYLRKDSWIIVDSFCPYVSIQFFSQNEHDKIKSGNHMN